MMVYSCSRGNKPAGIRYMLVCCADYLCEWLLLRAQSCDSPPRVPAWVGTLSDCTGCITWRPDTLHLPVQSPYHRHPAVVQPGTLVHRRLHNRSMGEDALVSPTPNSSSRYSDGTRTDAPSKGDSPFAAL